MTSSEFKRYVEFNNTLKFGITWKERWELAKDSNLTRAGRLFTVTLILTLYYLPILFVPPSYVNVEMYNFLAATVVGAGFWLFIFLAFIAMLLALIIIVPVIVWIIAGNYSVEYLFDPIRTLVDKFEIMYKIAFGDYKHKWDNLYYYLHPDKKAKILLNQDN